MKSEIARLRSRAGHDASAPALPGHVVESWQRCLERYNLMPDVMRPAEMLSYHELQTTLERHEAIVHLALPEIERLFQRLVDNEYLVSVASPQGVKLLFRCDHQFLGEMSAFGVLPGSIWSEEMRGTNGIGTCLKIGKPLSIIGDQHFNVNVHALTCTVAPVFGQGGAIESVVNVTSSRPVSDKTARLVRDIVERAARRIENKYFAHRNRRLRTLCLSHESDFIDIAAEARIAIDDSGRIVDVSSTAPLLLGQSREALVGAELGALMDFSQPLEEVRVARTELPERGGREIFATLLSEPAGGAARPAARHSPQAAAPPPATATTAPADTERLLLNQHLLEQLALAERMLEARAPILVQGETGVGKTTFARLLARRNGRGEGDVVVLNCAALTGADAALDRLSGLSNFTLVLDHVEETPLPTQARLLQLLSDDHVLNVRNIGLLSIAGCNLADPAQSGRLRADLYYRLKGTIIDLPPIRAMPNIEATIHAAIADEAMARGKPGLVLDDDARLILVNYHWPGNLRELRLAARQAAVLAENGRISINHLPEQIVNQIAHKNLSARSQSEASRIEAALRHNGGNVSETARYLGISRATLYRKIHIRKIRIPEG
ncbi:sigma-54-dependent Fis family transcriptional regulator [Ruixingdingia sedimenti]|uniref:Sigma 54-interacting transcriptional regulator n=1 Tax=Ruixingdingia sedimenti TaxID=3073604 RepID=A0ABU1F9A8_9RHOB|nr:sigma 54-interacting transcriptional regulator [Xinfangfangia sp. LG-4]MDR5653478.1 sigma 54-interacting transcriptional regulator [Xinfangfangia sp. LG-4]